MRFSTLLALFTPLLLVSGAAINARGPEANALVKREPTTTIIIIIIIHPMAKIGMPATKFEEIAAFQTVTSTSTYVPAVTGVAEEFAGEGKTVTLTSTRIEAPAITHAVV
jgi:hypothetical protein